MREGERRREDWAKGVGEQVDEVLKSLPGVRSRISTYHGPRTDPSVTDAREASLDPGAVAHRPAEDRKSVV